MLPVIGVLAGLAALIGGAELLTRGGSRLAIGLGVPPIIIGLTIVSLGTSSPELAVGIDAVINGHGGLAVGNIVGTNLVNLLLILGLSALIRAIALDLHVLRIDLPVITAVSVLLWILSLDGTLSRGEGMFLIAIGLAYTVVVVKISRAEPTEVQSGLEPVGKSGHRRVVDLVVLLTGLAIIVLGAELLVDGAVEIARELDVSDAVIGLTIVAIGTSAPELVTTLVSTLRGNRDIALGNLLGSSTYNIVIVLGVTLLFAPAGIAVPADVVAFHLPLMAFVALACVPIFVSGWRISRVEGAVFVLGYCVYLAVLLWTQA